MKAVPHGSGKEFGRMKPNDGKRGGNAHLAYKSEQHSHTGPIVRFANQYDARRCYPADDHARTNQRLAANSLLTNNLFFYD